MQRDAVCSYLQSDILTDTESAALNATDAYGVWSKISTQEEHENPTLSRFVTGMSPSCSNHGQSHSLTTCIAEGFRGTCFIILSVLYVFLISVSGEFNTNCVSSVKKLIHV
jgi:hypothetical protein